LTVGHKRENSLFPSSLPSPCTATASLFMVPNNHLNRSEMQCIFNFVCVEIKFPSLFRHTMAMKCLKEGDEIERQLISIMIGHGSCATLTSD
jgi:hypothetical protein